MDTPMGDSPGGRETLSALGLDCVLNDAIQVSTRSGGLHVYFKHGPDKGYGNTAGARGKALGDGIDTRSECGYVIAPGSAGYEFANPDATIDLFCQARAIPSQLVTALDAARDRKKEPNKRPYWTLFTHSPAMAQSSQEPADD
nr:bifunctional DNA primase/polymerase [Ruegeria sp. Ofav3-42]